MLAGIGKTPRLRILATADGQPHPLRVKKQTRKDGGLGKSTNSKRNGFGDRLRPKNSHCGPRKPWAEGLFPRTSVVCFPGVNASQSRLTALGLAVLAVVWLVQGLWSGGESGEPTTSTGPMHSGSCRRVPRATDSSYASPSTAVITTVEALEIPVNRGVAECLLQGTERSWCEVVIGSLGPGNEAAEVHLDWESFDTRTHAGSRRGSDDARCVPGQPLAKWRRVTSPTGSFPPPPKIGSAPLEDDDPSPLLKRESFAVHQREFHFPVWKPAVRGPGEWQGKTIVARLMAAQQRARVYVDLQDADGRVSRRAAETIASRLAEVALPVVEGWLGPITDVDGDGSLSVLVTSAVEQLPRGSEPLRAFVRSSDLDAGPQSGANSPHGPLDVIYLNANRLRDSGMDGILAHEATHLAVFCRRQDAGLPLRAEEWIDEGLAHAVEWLGTGDSDNLERRWAAFHAAPHAAALEVNRGVGHPAWRRAECRGATARFFTHLVEHQGARALPRIATAKTTGRDALAEATGQPFEDLFREWTMSERITWHEPESIPDFPEQGHQAWSLSGTAALGFLLGHLPADRCYRLRLTGPASAALQLTLVRHVRTSLSRPVSRPPAGVTRLGVSRR